MSKSIRIAVAAWIALMAAFSSGARAADNAGAAAAAGGDQKQGGAMMSKNELLIEAESFREKGGWVVDQQFVQQMGSPYLLAHGLGKPVANAKTTAEFPAAGLYRLWVRTKNWVPGAWEAPGRFKVLINGKAAKPVFGTRQGWGWQDGGVIEIAQTKATIELQDLTGFDGRCDALYFTLNQKTQDKQAPPPEEAKALLAWRNRLQGRPETPPSAGSFDLVIVGGGITGCAAALAADKQGLKTALIHDRPILGGNASGEVRVHTLGINGKGKSLISQIDTAHYPNGSADALKEDEKRQRNMEAARNVTMFLNCRAYGVVMSGKRIAAVNAAHNESGKTLRFDAPVFIDCTGDAWIGFWAGAEYRYGREPRSEFGEEWDKHGELWSPTAPDNRVMGASLLWYSKPTSSPETFPDVPWAMDVAKGKPATAGEWFWEYSANDKNQIDDAEEIRDHILKAIYGSFANAKKESKYATHKLDWVGYLNGKRESRRLIGDYVYTMKDEVAGTRFPDAVVEETREIDVHYQQILGAKGTKGESRDFLSTALFYKVPQYYIPFRSLYSKNIENLMMAGRCFSCSHVGLGGPRVMRTCGQMGIATGYAASLCKKYSTTPRGVYQQHLPDLLALVNSDAKSTSSSATADK